MEEFRCSGCKREFDTPEDLFSHQQSHGHRWKEWLIGLVFFSGALIVIVTAVIDSVENSPLSPRSISNVTEPGFPWRPLILGFVLMGIPTSWWLTRTLVRRFSESR